MIRAVGLVALLALTFHLEVPAAASERDPVAINQPAELRIRHAPALALSAFVVRDEPWRTGPPGQLATGPIVDAVDGAGGEQWVCHRGAWLVRVHH